MEYFKEWYVVGSIAFVFSSYLISNAIIEYSINMAAAIKKSKSRKAEDASTDEA